jgi:glucose-6-phosphate 1-dehydrogenase
MAVKKNGKNKQADALAFFGATGDLAYKQIFPALQQMIRDGFINVPIVGVAKAGWGIEQLRQRAHDSIEEHGGVDPAAFARLVELLDYVDGDYADPSTFIELRQKLGDAEHPMHYLAIPPSLFGSVAEQLESSGCAKGARIVVEKPFGHNLATAEVLNTTLHTVFNELSIYRIDHYLGKEATQNISYTRFANAFLDPIWNRDHIASVQITMAEAFDVTGRGRFYEEAGAIRDVIQNHMLQVLGLLAMEAPGHHDPESTRDARAAVLKCVRPLTPNDVVRGQYDGYRDEDGVAPDSTVETYAAVRCHVDSWRWFGVPWVIRVGKTLPVTATEVCVRLKRPALRVYDPIGRDDTNYVRFRISPEVAVAIGARVKESGEGMQGENRELRLVHHSNPRDLAPYSRLLHDAMMGDRENFARQDSVEAAWRVVDPILDNVTPIHPYARGTWGPEAADHLLPRGTSWHDPLAHEPEG